MITLGLPKKGADHRQALRRVTEQTRNRFKLGPEAVVMVAELACTLPGCPPVDTVVVFWTPDGVRHRFRIFKPVVQVTEDDLPYVWLMRSLAAPEGLGDDCC
jgi:nitrate reductase delta subunit